MSLTNGSPPPGRKSVWKNPLFILFSAVCEGTAAALAVIADGSHGRAKILYAMGIAIAAIAPAVAGLSLDLLHRYREALAKAISAEQNVATLTNALAAERAHGEELERDLVDALALLAVTLDEGITLLANLVSRIHLAGTEDERAQLRGQLEMAVCKAATRLCGGDGIRACYYRKVMSGSRVKGLQLQAWTGRSAYPPRDAFKRDGGLRDNEVIAVVLRKLVHFVGDVRDTADADHYEGKSYRTLIAVSVPMGTGTCGMLAVDAPSPGDLDHETHVPLVQALAAVLGSGLAG